MKSIPVFILVALFASLYALAEEDESFSLGISAGWNRSAHNFKRPNFLNDTSSACACFSYNKSLGENGDGFSGGLSFDLPLTYGNWGLSLLARLNYEKMIINHFYDDIWSYMTKEDSINHTRTVNHTRYSLIFTDQILILDLLFRIKLSDTELGFIAGPSLCYTLSSNILDQVSIIEPKGVSYVPVQDPIIKYRDNNRTLVIYDDELPDINKFRIAASFGMNYNLDIPSISTRIVPWFMYYFDLTQLRKDWDVTAIRTGVDIRYVF